MTEGNSSTLLVHEWIAVVFILFLLLILTLMTFKTTNSEVLEFDPPHYVVEPNIKIALEGAVENPGILEIKRGSTVRDALKLAKPLPEANVSKLKLDAKLRNGQTIKVPSSTQITINVDGLGNFKVPRGTRLKDLPALLDLPETVDRSQFNSKRVLKDNETLFLKLL